MADETFQQFLVEQKKTNELLRKQILDDQKGDNLLASAKNAAAEIGNTIIQERKNRKEHDETQEAVRTSVKDVERAIVNQGAIASKQNQQNQKQQAQSQKQQTPLQQQVLALAQTQQQGVQNQQKQQMNLFGQLTSQEKREKAILKLNDEQYIGVLEQREVIERLEEEIGDMKKALTAGTEGSLEFYKKTLQLEGEKKKLAAREQRRGSLGRFGADVAANPIVRGVKVATKQVTDFLTKFKGLVAAALLGALILFVNSDLYEDLRQFVKDVLDGKPLAVLKALGVAILGIAVLLGTKFKKAFDLFAKGIRKLGGFFKSFIFPKLPKPPVKTPKTPTAVPLSKTQGPGQKLTGASGRAARRRARAQARVKAPPGITGSGTASGVKPLKAPPGITGSGTASGVKPLGPSVLGRMAKVLKIIPLLGTVVNSAAFISLLLSEKNTEQKISEGGELLGGIAGGLLGMKVGGIIGGFPGALIGSVGGLLLGEKLGEYLAAYILGEDISKRVDEDLKRARQSITGTGEQRGAAVVRLENRIAEQQDILADPTQTGFTRGEARKRIRIDRATIKRLKQTGLPDQTQMKADKITQTSSDASAAQAAVNIVTAPQITENPTEQNISLNQTLKQMGSTGLAAQQGSLVGAFA